MVNYRRLGSVRKEFLLLRFTVYQKTASSLSSICTGQYPLRQRNSVTSPHVFRYTNHLFKEAGLIQTLSSTPDYSHLVFLVFAKGKTVSMQRSSQHVTKTDWFLREREKSIFLVNRVTFKHWIGVLSFLWGHHIVQNILAHLTWRERCFQSADEPTNSRILIHVTPEFVDKICWKGAYSSPVLKVWQSIL